MDNSVVTAAVLFATVLLRWVLVAVVVWLLIPRRRECPACREVTARVVTPRLVRAFRIERRLCLACGWSGISKMVRFAPHLSGSPTTPILPIVLVFLSAAVGCAPREDPVDALFRDAEAWVDLTHPFDARTIYWPTSQPFALETVAAGVTEAGFYYAANNFAAAEHGGTHLDAPIHFAAGRRTADQIPLAHLVGPAVVVDVSARTADNPDYRVTAEDLAAFEAAYGRIPDGAIVLFRTGWASRWPDPVQYLGTDQRGPDAVPLLHFPGVDSAAARWLVTERSIDAVGIDTPSIDYGQSTTFDTHQILLGANIPAFENVANLDRMPETGGYVVALPMKIAGGSGGPLRIVGVVPRR